MRMEMVDDPTQIPPVQAEAQAEINAAEGAERAMLGVERFKFYDLAKTSYAIIQTGRTSFLWLHHVAKSVIPPNKADALVIVQITS